MPRIKTPRVINQIVDSYYVAKALKAEVKYEMSILESQDKIGPYKPVPYVPVVTA